MRRVVGFRLLDFGLVAPRFCHAALMVDQDLAGAIRARQIHAGPDTKVYLEMNDARVSL